MIERWRIWAFGGIALALWLGPAILTAPEGPTGIVLTSDLPVVLPMERISAAGVHYGQCIGVVLAVVLDPEPCGWDRSRSYRNVASR